MALLRNREVSIVGKVDGQDESPMYTVMYKDGERENTHLSELQLTEDEHKNLAKQQTAVLDKVQIIKPEGKKK